jgi:hypothetical protein
MERKGRTSYQEAGICHDAGDGAEGENRTLRLTIEIEIKIAAKEESDEGM